MSWLIKGSIIEIKLMQHCPIEELMRLDRDVLVHFQAQPTQPIHLLFDVTELIALPSLSRMRTLETIRQPNLGWCVNFGALNPFVRSLVTGLAILVGARQRFFGTRKRALQFLQQIDPSVTIDPVI